MTNLLSFKTINVELNFLELSLLGAVTFCFLVQLYFLLFVHLKLLRVAVAEIPEQAALPLSVIISARNEAENLTKYLPSVLHQNYSNFEVVVVNDRSWDGTADVLEGFEKKYPHLKIVTVSEGEKFIAGKKFAVTMGIKAASNEWLVFTDADCEPASDSWLKGMQQPSAESQEILLGHAPYFKKGGLLNAFIRFETFFTAVNYLSYALKGKPYMGVGRNMAYKKSLFFKNKGFAAHMHVASGEDDLFVNARANKTNTSIVINKDSQVWSEPKTSLIAYSRQKKRHLGAKKLYKKSDRLMLSTQKTVYFLFYALVIALLCFNSTRYLALGILVLSLIIRSFIYPSLLKRLNYDDLRWWFPILDILLLFFIVFNSIVSIFVKKVIWNN
jgi:biofilm PGA synthesis N-glycosyltransferase PgaC